MSAQEKIPKFSGKVSKFAMFSAKVKVYLAMKLLGPTLVPSFKDSLPTSEQELLDLTKPKTQTKMKCKQMNLHALNLLTIMMAENDLMLMMVDSVKSKEWPDGMAYVNLCALREALEEVQTI